MKCPFCGHLESKVIDSRASREGDAIRRRRQCEACQKRFTSYERVLGPEDNHPPMVVKKDGRRESFDREKILQGLQLACKKRPIPTERIEAVADAIEGRLMGQGTREVPSSWIGEQVMEALRELDKVAYVRFASVYKEFRDEEEFLKEIKALRRRRRKPPQPPTETLFDSQK
jgi:transcriptional repressor NrdR